jgi:dihydropteroate synthase
MFTLNCKGRLVIIDKPVVMGIINTTPDSFFAGSRMEREDDLLQRAEKMVSEGAMILDLGGQSTRPGSRMVEPSEELDRVVPAIELVHRSFPGQIISVDTFYSSVAKAAVNAGATIINDISAGMMDPDLLPFVAEEKLPYVLMHMPGTPADMQKRAIYKDVTGEVFDFLNNRISELIHMGINDIIVDPGFGFGKTAEHNFRLLRELSYFTQLQKPLLAGLSRKATVYKTLGVTAEEALNGTTVLNTLALANGASILRVHDVKEAMEAITLYQVYKQ